MALYDKPQQLPLPDMYGKNLTFRTGGVDGCDCEKILSLIANGKLDTAPLITHFYPLRDISAAYDLFEHRMDHVMKVGIIPDDSCESGFLACANETAVHLLASTAVGMAYAFVYISIAGFI